MKWEVRIMKSKTSCFNTTIFRKNFTHYWPLWALYLCYLLFIVPMNLYLSMSQEYYGYNQNYRHYSAMESALEVGLLPFPVFLFAAVMAAAVFSYLYAARNANMIHALPVDRFELYVTNYLSGLSFMLFPELIVFVVSVLVCVATGITCMQYLLMWFLCIAGMTFFAYSLAVLVAMLTGQIFAVPVYFLIVNYLYVGSMYLICSLIELISYGVSDYWNPGVSCILSPIYYLGNNLRARRVTEAGSDIVTGISFKGGWLVAVYAVSALALVAAACWLYKKRQIESAGDMISIGIVKPVFRWGAALLGGFLLSVSMIRLFENYRRFNTYLWILVCIVVFGFLCFFIAEMFLEKSFKVFRKKRLVEWAAFTAVAIVFLSLFKLDVFGIERYLPAEEEIEAAFVNMDYPLEIPAEDYKELLALHAKVIESKAEYEKNAKGEAGYYYTTFRYYLKDGSVAERRYPFPVTEEYRGTKGTPTEVILSWETETEQMKQRILGRNYRENQYYSGSIDLYARDGRSNTCVLTEEQLDAVLAAVERDIEAGNFDRLYLDCLGGEDEVRYMNGLSLNYFNRNRVYDNWDYYQNYRNYHGLEQLQPSTVDTGGYISLGPACENVIGTLEELGVVDDTWLLATYEEYQEYTGAK